MFVFFSSITTLFCLYLLYLIFFWQWGKNYQPFYNKEQRPIMGHRGSPNLFTENTILSFEKAIDQGVDGLELDVRLSKDRQIVVFHDPNLKRLSDRTEKIQDLSLTELQRIALHKQDNQKEEAYIPTLNDLVPLFNQIKVLNIEIKTDAFLKGHDIINLLIKFLDKHKIDDKCIVSSFNPLILMKLKRRRPRTIIGFLYNRKKLLHGWDNMIWMLRVQPDNLHVHYSLLDSWIVRWARKKGMHINSYTINDKKVFDETNADGVFTDNIEYLK